MSDGKESVEPASPAPRPLRPSPAPRPLRPVPCAPSPAPRPLRPVPCAPSPAPRPLRPAAAGLPAAATRLCVAPSASPAAAETQQVDEQVKSQLEEKENNKFPVLKAVEFKHQLVAGTNFFLKGHVGEDQFGHLRVFKPLPRQRAFELLRLDCLTDKAKNDEVTCF